MADAEKGAESCDGDKKTDSPRSIQVPFEMTRVSVEGRSSHSDSGSGSGKSPPALIQRVLSEDECGDEQQIVVNATTPETGEPLSQSRPQSAASDGPGISGQGPDQECSEIGIGIPAEKELTPRRPTPPRTPPPPVKPFRQRFKERIKDWFGNMNRMGVHVIETTQPAGAVIRGKNKGPEKVHVERQAALNRVEDVIRKNAYLLPDSRFRRVWDAVMLFSSLVQVIMTPLLIIDMFPFSWGVILAFLMLTVLNALDAGVRCNTALIRGDEVVRDIRVARSYYFRRWLLIDVLVSIPADCIMALALPNEDSAWIRWFSVTRMLRLDHVRTLFTLSNPGAIDPDYVRFYFNVVPGLQFVFWFTFGLHFLTVLKLAIADDTPGNPDNENDRRYDYALFWVWNLLTTSPAPLTLNSYIQRVLCFVMMCLGVVFQGIIIGQVSLMLLKSGVRQQNEAKMRTTLDIVMHYNLPDSLKQEVLSMQWHSLQSSLNFLSNAGTIFDKLPALMRNEINIYIKIDFIAKCSMFQDARHHTKIKLANSLLQEFKEPGEQVIVTGDVGQEMYFMLHGFCEVMITNVGCVAVLRRGDFFGEVALLADVPRTATIRTLTYCDFFVLHREPFTNICDGDVMFRLNIREKMQAKLPKTGEEVKLRHRRKWRLAKNVIMLRRQMLPQDDRASRDDGEASSDESGSSESSDVSVNSDELIHQMAMAKTQQDAEQRTVAARLLEIARRARGEAPKARRKSVPMNFTAFASKRPEYPPPPAPPEASGVSKALENAKLKISPSNGALAHGTTSPPTRPTVTLPSAGTLLQRRSMQDLGQRRSMHDPGQRQPLCVEPPSPNPPRLTPRKSGDLRQWNKQGAADSPTGSPKAAMSKAISKIKSFGGGAAGNQRSQLASLSTDDKVIRLLDKMDEMSQAIGHVQEQLSWHGQALDDLSERHEYFADDIFAAVKSVEQQVWTVLDLQGVALDEMGKVEKKEKKKVDHTSEYKAFAELL